MLFWSPSVARLGGRFVLGVVELFATSGFWRPSVVKLWAFGREVFVRSGL